MTQPVKASNRRVHKSIPVSQSVRKAVKAVSGRAMSKKHKRASAVAREEGSAARTYLALGERFVYPRVRGIPARFSTLASTPAARHAV